VPADGEERRSRGDVRGGGEAEAPVSIGRRVGDGAHDGGGDGGAAHVHAARGRRDHDAEVGGARRAHEIGGPGGERVVRPVRREDGAKPETGAAGLDERVEGADGVEGAAPRVGAKLGHARRQRHARGLHFVALGLEAVPRPRERPERALDRGALGEPRERDAGSDRPHPHAAGGRRRRRG
jgi:hypothetical protein